MLKIHALGRAAAAAFLALTFAGCGDSGPSEVVFELTGNDQMQFSKARLDVQSPAKITVRFKNEGKQPKVAMGHNFVLLRPGVKPIEFATRCLTKGGKLENDFLPDSEKGDVIANTKILGPGEEAELVVNIDKKGRYPYVCTFTGHAAVMQGVIVAR